jgi:hypothetical protein
MSGITTPVGQPSAGGLSGPQQTAATYAGQEQLVSNAGKSAQSGIGGSSTMLTLQDAGARDLAAQAAMGMSDQDAAAVAANQVNTKAGAQSNLTNIFGGIGKLFGAL